MPKKQAEDGVMTIGDVAAYLKVTDRTIYRLAAANKIPAFKVGGMWRFLKQDIEAWIKTQSSQDRKIK
jgi:excisionase family DNA binding protein